MKTLRIFLLVLIIIGIVLLLTQNIWVPKLVNKILQNEGYSKTSLVTTKHFVDTNNTFTFDYNPLFSVTGGNNNPPIDWRLNTQDKGELLTSVLIPKLFLPTNTNFSDARLTIGKSTDKNAIKNCLSVSNGEINAGSTKISNFSFEKITSNGAGAGNLYDTTSYRGIVNKNCYSIEYTIHSTNIGNYSPDQGIKEFDKAKVQNELENIIKSFKFLINSN